MFVLKMETWLYNVVMCLKCTDRMANPVDPEEQFDLGLHYFLHFLLRPSVLIFRVLMINRF